MWVYANGEVVLQGGEVELIGTTQGVRTGTEWGTDCNWNDGWEGKEGRCLYRKRLKGLQKRSLMGRGWEESVVSQSLESDL